jgi:uncharacterized protein (TIGR00299 family) protein
MKIAYFDCFSGISGDMTLGALLDAGLELKVLKRELGRLRLDGYEISQSRVSRGGITGTKFDCLLKDSGRTSHSHSTLGAISDLIKSSGLSKGVKDLSSRIFLALGRAEAKIHGCRLDDVHFHEIGNIDSIVDIVGTAIAVSELGIDKCHSSEVAVGRGRVNTRGGLLPLPSPAAAEILKGVPVRMSSSEGELVTPTGVAILKTLCDSFGAMPRMRIEKIGYGAGSSDFKEMPNMLRVMLGEPVRIYKEDKIVIVETNIDDMSPQVFDYLFDRLFEAGVRDVYVSQVYMKKSRPAFQLNVLADEHLLEKVASIIFEETTSIGLRYYTADRLKLERKVVNVDTKYGRVDVKLGMGPDGIKAVSPEYDACVRIAKNKKVPFKAVYEEARKKVTFSLSPRSGERVG